MVGAANIWLNSCWGWHVPGVIQQHEAADSAEEAPLWWRVLQETAQQAHSCEAELGELVQGLGGILVITLDKQDS